MFYIVFDFSTKLLTTILLFFIFLDKIVDNSFVEFLKKKARSHEIINWPLGKRRQFF